MEKSIVIPEAYMTMQRVGGYSVALTGGQWANWHPTHCPEKYSKFVYSSRYAFNVSRSTESLYSAAPDSSLAFEICDSVFYRQKCLEHRIQSDGSHYSKWSPYRGITVETILIPTDGGHLRRHTVECDFDCVAYDTAFATPLGGGGEIHGQGGEELILECEPNTNLIYPKCEIKAVKYTFKKGRNTVETNVIYPKN